MAASFLVGTVQGNVGSDPRVNDTPTGKRVANVSIAAKTSFNREEPPTWVEVEVWGQQANYVEQYIKKGMSVAATGSISMKSFTGRDGTERTKLVMRANSIQNNSPRPSNDDEAMDDLPV